MPGLKFNQERQCRPLLRVGLHDRSESAVFAGIKEMLMDKRALKLLEYDKIIKMLSERTASGLGRSLSEALIPSADPREVEYRLMETNHAAAYRGGRARRHSEGSMISDLP